MEIGVGVTKLHGPVTPTDTFFSFIFLCVISTFFLFGYTKGMSPVDWVRKNGKCSQLLPL